MVCVKNCFICGWQIINEDICCDCSEEMEKGYITGNILSGSAIKKIVTDKRLALFEKDAKDRLQKLTSQHRLSVDDRRVK